MPLGNPGNYFTLCFVYVCMLAYSVHLSVSMLKCLFTSWAQLDLKWSAMKLSTESIQHLIVKTILMPKCTVVMFPPEFYSFVPLELCLFFHSREIQDSTENIL